ncbi:MAG: hypothetical protein R8J84_04645 [Mariprofundales bacterium]
MGISDLEDKWLSMLSDAAFASALTGLFRTNLLLPQLDPPVRRDSQAQRVAAAEKQSQQNSQAQISAEKASQQRDQERVSSARAVANRLLSQALTSELAAAGQQQVRGNASTELSAASRETLGTVSSAERLQPVKGAVRAPESDASQHVASRDVSLQVEAALALLRQQVSSSSSAARVAPAALLQRYQQADQATETTSDKVSRSRPADSTAKSVSAVA